MSAHHGNKPVMRGDQVENDPPCKSSTPSSASNSKARDKDAFPDNRQSLVTGGKTKLAKRTQQYLLKLREGFREGGLPEVVGIATGTLGYLIKKYLFDSTAFVILRHNGVPETIIKARTPVTVRIIEQSQLEDVARLNGAEPGSAQFRLLRKYFQSGNECFGAYHEGELVCAGWGLHQEDYYEAYDLKIRPKPGEVLLSGGFTAPEFRGRRIRECMLGHQINYFCSRGLRCIVAIQSTNIASLRVFSRYGFEQHGLIRRLKIFGMRMTRTLSL